MVDIDTAEILAVAEGKGESRRSSTSLTGGGGSWGGFGAGGVNFGSSDFQATIIGGATSTPSINSPSAPFNQSIGPGVVMGDFAHDLFSGAHDDHTYIAAHNSDAYIDLGAFSLAAGKAVQAH